MADAPLTPEEKLLRIIESPREAARGMRPMRRQSQDFKVLFKLLKARYGEKIKAFLNFKSANALLVACAGLVTLYLLIDFIGGMPRLEHVRRLELMAKKLDVGDLSLGQLDTLSAYLQEITQRNIFALPAAASKKEDVKDTGSQTDFNALLDGLKVVGIIWSNMPQAIIEDSKGGRTYLLNRGGSIKGARVKDILKDRVILSYDNQEAELR